MTWTVTYYNEAVRELILKLPDSLLARYLRLTDLMQVYGINLGMPHSKSFGKGLYELRLKGKEGIARVFYCTFVSHEICILHGFIKKTNKTPKKELQIAFQRLQEVKAYASKNT